jgi:hypothetical protein
MTEDDSIDEARLRELSEQAAALPRSIDPPSGAWAGIRSAIEADRNAPFDREQVATPHPAFWQRPIFLAAAAVALVAGSSVVTAVAMREIANRGNTVVAASPERPSETLTQSSSGPASLAQFTVVESDYLRAVNDLSATLESERGSLSPETIAKLRESLRIIDTAILEARNALAADPANRTLIEMLANSYEQKVDLLKRTTEMGRG